MTKVFYAVFFVMVQGSPVFWSTQPQNVYFDSEEQCGLYIDPIKKSLVESILEQEIQGNEQIIIAGWCVEKLTEKETDL